MRRWLLLSLPLALLLSGCGGPAAPAEPDSPADPTEAAVLAAYDAAAEVYDWFDLCSLPTAGEAVTVDGITYWPVAYEGLAAYADLEARVRACFAPALADEILQNSQNYRDIGGNLYTQDGARGANIYLLDKTVEAAQVDGGRWTVTITFWADYTDHIETPLPGTGETTLTLAATTGYSRTTLDYERTEDGWRFTDFCPTDGLDLDADTVFEFQYDWDSFAKDEQDMEHWSDFKLACWLLHADALSEGASDLLARRFLEDPDTWFSQLSVLVDSPLENAHFPMEGPAYAIYAWYGEAEQRRFQDILDACQPKSSAEQSLLDGLKAARERAMALATEDAAASFCLAADGQFLSLGGKEGAFPWGLDLEARSRTYHEGTDGFYPFYEADCGGLTVWYSVSPDDGAESVFRISIAQAGAHTLGGIEVGDAEADVQAAYPAAIPLEAVGEWQTGADHALIYEPGGLAYCKHIAFFIRDGIVTSIEIEDLMDGQLLAH